MACGVLGVGAAELVHEVGDHAVKVQAVVEPLFCELDEISTSDGHCVDEDLSFEIAHTGFKLGDWITHEAGSTEAGARRQGCEFQPEIESALFDRRPRRSTSKAD